MCKAELGSRQHKYAGHEILRLGPRHQRGSSKEQLGVPGQKHAVSPLLQRAGFELPLVERKRIEALAVGVQVSSKDTKISGDVAQYMG